MRLRAPPRSLPSRDISRSALNGPQSAGFQATGTATNMAPLAVFIRISTSCFSLDLLNRGKIETNIRRVLADADDGFTDEPVGWHRQIVGGWYAVKYTSCQIVL